MAVVKKSCSCLVVATMDNYAWNVKKYKQKHTGRAHYSNVSQFRLSEVTAQNIFFFLLLSQKHFFGNRPLRPFGPCKPLRTFHFSYRSLMVFTLYLYFVLLKNSALVTCYLDSSLYCRIDPLLTFLHRMKCSNKCACEFDVHPHSLRCRLPKLANSTMDHLS